MVADLDLSESMAMPLQLRFKRTVAHHPNMANPTKAHQRTWIICCVFILCAALVMIGNASGSLDLALCRAHKSIQQDSQQQEVPGQQQSAERISAHQLEIESSRAQPSTAETSSTSPTSAPINKVAICTSIKWEQPADLEEWVQYYQCVTAAVVRFCGLGYV